MESSSGERRSRSNSPPRVQMNSDSMSMTLRTPSSQDTRFLIQLVNNKDNTSEEISLADMTLSDKQEMIRECVRAEEPQTTLRFIILVDDVPAGLTGFGRIVDQSTAGIGTSISEKVGQMGVIMMPEKRRKGYASEALAMTIAFGLGIQGLSHVTIQTSKNNEPMVNLMISKFGTYTTEKRNIDGTDSLLWVFSREGYFLGNQTPMTPEELNTLSPISPPVSPRSPLQSSKTSPAHSSSPSQSSVSNDRPQSARAGATGGQGVSEREWAATTAVLAVVFVLIWDRLRR